MSAYAGLLAILVVWSFVVLRRGAPLRTYAMIYAINALIALVTEGVFTLVLHRYSFGGLAGFFLTTVGISPLLTVLYAHYAQRRPLLMAVTVAVILGGVVELLLLNVKAFHYERGWSPYWTIAAFTAYFLWTWWLAEEALFPAETAARR